MVSILTKIESLCIPLTKADSGGFEPLSLRSAIFILRGALHNWAWTILLSSRRKQIAVFARNEVTKSRVIGTPRFRGSLKRHEITSLATTMGCIRIFILVRMGREDWLRLRPYVFECLFLTAKVHLTS